MPDDVPSASPAAAEARKQTAQGYRWPISLSVVARLSVPSLFLVYGLGFVILGFNDARYGVVQFSPFRTRILLVGLVFGFLVSLAAWAQHARIGYFDMLKSVRADADPARHWHKEGVLACGFIFTATYMATVFGWFILSFPEPKTHGPFDWRILALWITVWLAAMVTFNYVDSIFVRKPRTAGFIATLVYVLFVTFLMWQKLPSAPMASLIVFFVLVGALTSSVKRSGGIVNYMASFWSWPIIFLVFWIYVANVFVAMPQRWGGGQPAPVQIFLNVPAKWSRSNPLDALLLDETDQGIYVLLSPKGRSFFVPENDVASIFYGTQQDLAKSERP